MKKTFMTITIAFSMLALMFLPAFAVYNVSATNLDPWGGQEDDLRDITGLGSNDPREVAAGVINIILSFLGIIAVVIILLGGFKWMTAAGNEEKVEEAQKLIKAGIIGLIIILAAWGIASFVISSLIKVV